MTARDVIFAMVFIFFIAIALLITHFMVGSVVDNITSNGIVNQSNKTVEVFESMKTVSNKYDYLIFSVFLALILGIIITGWFIGGIPIFMIIYFLVVVIVVIISSVLANVWESISTTSTFISTLTYFPITNNIMLNFPLYMAIIGFLGIVAMFAKPYFQGGQQ